MSERNVLLKNVKHPFLVGLHYSFQTADKLYFVLDYINGGEVSYLLGCRLEGKGIGGNRAKRVKLRNVDETKEVLDVSISYKETGGEFLA